MKNFLGREHSPLPRPFPRRGGGHPLPAGGEEDTPSPHPTPLGAFGASPPRPPPKLKSCLRHCRPIIQNRLSEMPTSNNTVRQCWHGPWVNLGITKKCSEDWLKNFLKYFLGFPNSLTRLTLEKFRQDLGKKT